MKTHHKRFISYKGHQVLCTCIISCAMWSLHFTDLRHGPLSKDVIYAAFPAITTSTKLMYADKLFLSPWLVTDATIEYDHYWKRKVDHCLSFDPSAVVGCRQSQRFSPLKLLWGNGTSRCLFISQPLLESLCFLYWSVTLTSEDAFSKEWWSNAPGQSVVYAKFLLYTSGRATSCLNKYSVLLHCLRVQAGPFAVMTHIAWFRLLWFGVTLLYTTNSASLSHMVSFGAPNSIRCYLPVCVWVSAILPKISLCNIF